MGQLFANRVSNARALGLQTNKKPFAQKKTRKTGGSSSQPPAKPGAKAPRLESRIAAEALANALIQQSQGASLDQGLTRALKIAPKMSADERRQVVQDLYAVNRHLARLSWHIEQVGAQVTPATLLSAWMAFVSQGVQWGEDSGLEDRALMKLIAGRQLYDRAMPDAVRLECPPTFEPALREVLGDHFDREMNAALQAPPIDLRVNLLRCSREEAIKRLHWEKIEAKVTPLSPWGLRCSAGENVSATRCFQDGYVEFQDEGSQLAAVLTDARPGMQVMDFCSGTGGKTLALAASMQNKGHLVATDISEVRLSRAKLRMRRAGAENAERIKLPAQDDKALKKRYGKFDRVLVDAPCSGTGSWRRNPDVRWSSQAANLPELMALQSAILERASRFVSTGGHLIYATCSLLKCENDERVHAFLQAHPEFELLDASELWGQLGHGDWMCGEERFLRLSPAKHRTDGFFAAVLRKVTIPA